MKKYAIPLACLALMLTAAPIMPAAANDASVLLAQGGGGGGGGAGGGMGRGGGQGMGQGQGMGRGSTTADDGQIYGRQLMTQEEMNRYRQRMRNAKTAQEREQIRAENHKQMQERARQRGVTLPDEPPANRGPGSMKGPGRNQ